jgi:hypothetical protein
MTAKPEPRSSSEVGSGTVLRFESKLTVPDPVKFIVAWVNKE